MPTPQEETAARLAHWRAAAARAERADARLAAGRLAVAVAAAALAWLAFASHLLSGWWLALPAAAFVALALRHQRVLDGWALAKRACALHERALERMAGRFAGHGTDGARFLAPDHRYAADLDLFGPGSLFELLCTARTAPGEARLAAWLLGPAGAGEVRARQRAVAALAPRTGLREALALLGEDVRAVVDAEELTAWAAEPPRMPAWTLPASAVLVAATAAAAAAWAAGLAGAVPFLLALAAEGLFTRALGRRMAPVLAGLERPVAELRVLALLLARLEVEPFDDPRDPHLLALQAALHQGGRSASAEVARLAALSHRLEQAKNQLFAPLAFALLWLPLHAVALERWRAACGGAVARWLDAVAELEALSALAGHAYERPDHVVPEILDPGDGPRLEGTAVRHPLLPGAVPNDVRLGGEGPRLLLVSGSNMSGKSTYLRTVGVNVVLALSGARVPAARLALTPLHLGATLRIQDSLAAGRSRFYAEIERLKVLQDLAGGAPPLLALLDEILHGTNSHDRRIGAEAFLRTLLERGAIGLVTTHDLALTGLAAAEGSGRVRNGHFEDQVREGRLDFDYRLREGVVGHSNALELMRSVGLKV